MARQLHYPPNLRGPLHDHRSPNHRLDRFLIERRQRDGFYGDKFTNDRGEISTERDARRHEEHERENARHERWAQELRAATPRLFKNYLKTLCTNYDSISAQLNDLDLKDGDYQSRSAYKYGKPSTPSFSGSEATFIDFVRECIAWCRVKKMPNQLQDYLFKRMYSPHWTEELVISDRELYGMFDSWLSGSAKSFTMNRLQVQSGHLVFADLIEKFLARSPQKLQHVSMELNNIQFQDESIKAVKSETIPQFFTRARTLQFRFKCIGGECSESTLVQHCASGLMAHTKLFFHVSQILDASPDCDTFALETSLLNKITLNNTVQKKKAVLAHFAQAREANMSVTGGGPRPWEQEQRPRGDRTGIGANKRVRFAAPDAPNKKPWFALRGKNVAEQKAALKRDYEANLAAIDAHASANTENDTTGGTAEAHDGMQVMLAAIEHEEDPFCGMMLAHHDAPSHAHTAMLAQTQPHLLTIDSGATDHIFNTYDAFDPDTVEECSIPITTAGSTKIKAEAKGDVTVIITLPSGLPAEHTFKDCLFVPKAQRNLVSAIKLARNEGCKIIIDGDGGQMVLPTGQHVTLQQHGRLLAIPTEDRQAFKLRRAGWRNHREHDARTIIGRDGGVGCSDGSTIYAESMPTAPLQLPHTTDVYSEVRDIAQTLSTMSGGFDTARPRPTLVTPSLNADADARAGCTDYAGDTPMHNNRAADFALSPMPTPTQPATAQATRGTKRPPFDAGGYERLDSDSSSDSDSDSASDDEDCDFMTMVNAGYKEMRKREKRLKRER